MPTLEYFIAAESCVIDRQTNRLSIFNVLEEVTPTFLQGNDWPIVIPELVAVSGWNPDPAQANDAEHQVTLRVHKPGDEPQNYVQTVVMQPGRRARLMNRIAGIDIREAGELRIEILLDGVHAATHTVTISDPVALDQG